MAAKQRLTKGRSKARQVGVSRPRHMCMIINTSTAIGVLSCNHVIGIWCESSIHPFTSNERSYSSIPHPELHFTNVEEIIWAMCTGCRISCQLCYCLTSHCSMNNNRDDAPTILDLASRSKRLLLVSVYLHYVIFDSVR